VIRKNVIILHANLAEFTLEGRPIANRVVKLLTIKMCFHYKFFIFIFKIQGHTCSPILLHVAFKSYGLVGWTSKNLHMNMPQLKTQQQNPNFILQFCDKQQIVTFFFNKLPINMIQLTIAHGKTIVVNMILQIFCN
jgi:hypothetical protein